MNSDKLDIIYQSIKFIKTKLGIKTDFSLLLSYDKSKFKTFAYYNLAEKKVAVYVKSRALPDIIRSLFHEIVHVYQHENDRIKAGAPDIGKMDDPYDIENEANAKAGSLIKEFSYLYKDKKNIDIYTL